ncbi:tRNA (guanosine(46)-N7)-methyltransferase TrmB [Reichenbachiella versicolor]|uniref:tRNA (guanosine(46)-N7)-methyltransferase TrmB n=1 Tax=Reichenbachiella versicolor TaxID=1821036 RepID=UPI000D6E7745|nr:tRNA (guanosine(46)-N7)-methyltransferase TrmB [Reichenbachiella versicolor]
MGRRGKMERFAENAERNNVIEIGKESFGNLVNKWKTDHFKNTNDVVVELGCGKGEYTVGLSRYFPERNFIGVDIKGARIWVGSTQAVEERLENVAFLRTQIELLDKHFGENEIDELWITFPDPRPKERDEKKRLTCPKFLDMYRKLLVDDGWVKFKTDSTFLFDYTLDVLKSQRIKNLVYTHNLYDSEYMDEHYGVKTKFEKMFYEKGEDIKYLRFQFDY